MIEIIKDRFFSAIVCCDIDPAREDCFDELDRQLEPIYNGTEHGWKALRPDNWRFTHTDVCCSSEWEEAKPRPCDKHEGRWHYVVIT